MTRYSSYLNSEDDLDEEDSLLGSSERQVEQPKPWDTFKLVHRKPAVGSTVETAFIDYGTKVLKVATVFFITIVVLGAAVLSKITLFLMTSQVGEQVTRPYCNRDLDVDRTYEFTVPENERKTWIWFIMLAYFVTELGTFIRSVRIMCFKSWKFPSITEDFLPLLATESLAAVGSALFVFCVLPEVDALRGAFIANAMCLIPALFNGLKQTLKLKQNSHKKNSGKISVGMLLDCTAILVQLGAALTFSYFNPEIRAVLPLSVIFISLGWWENFLPDIRPIESRSKRKSEKSFWRDLSFGKKLQQFFGEVSDERKEFHNSRYVSYVVVSLVKCLIFFTITVIKFSLVEGRDVTYLFSGLGDIFSDHVMDVNEVVPIPGTTPAGYPTTTSYITSSAIIWGINVLSTYVCYACAKFACKVMIQSYGFAVPILTAVPILSLTLSVLFQNYFENVCSFHNTLPDYLFFKTPNPSTNFLLEAEFWVWFGAFLSQVWITQHIWRNKNTKLASTEMLFVRPVYDPFLIDQSLAMNRRIIVKQSKISGDEPSEETEEDEDTVTRIYACATMWHENEEEMLEFLKSVYRLDEDQGTRRIMRARGYPDDEYYELETHVFFDDAFVRKSKNDNDPSLNTFVHGLISTISKAATEVHKVAVRIRPPIIYPTPYGGRLQWILPGKTKLIVHLKDRAKIRAKKRWSQVMYMYYLLGHRLMDNDALSETSISTRAKNTYLLALDGDIDFQPEAVHLLVQYMKKNIAVGACCGRIHPVGSGTIAWYQIFEYAVGHWMQKATEHVIGCVLCSPGCFSLFRASALMDHNVMARYTTVSSEARHYVQYDQGEDRWLCTLLLQRGYRVEYSAASDAYTHCPEGFNEFYNQRRRWMPSTTANILNLLQDSEHIRKVNDNISMFYIWYQVILMIGTAIGPGTIFLMLVGAFVTVFKLTQWTAFWYNLIPIGIFVFTCIICESDTQLTVAAAVSAFYGLVMMAVMIGVVVQIEEDGPFAPSSLFFFIMMAEYVIAAIIHPKEFYCLKYGIIYLVTVPSMYMLLVIYSVFNMNNVSWGTRDVTIVPDKKDNEEEEEEEVVKTPTSMIVEWVFKLRDFFMSCMNNPAELVLINDSLMHIKGKVDHIGQKVEDLERIAVDPESASAKKTLLNMRKPTILEGPKGARPSVMPTKKNQQEDFHGSDAGSHASQSDDFPTNSWYYEGELIKGHVTFLDKKEEKFWNDLHDKYLHPIEDDKKKVAKDLSDLRDKMVMTFFAINSLFVLVVFLLTLKKDIINLKWPFNPKTNFTYTTTSFINEIVVDQTFLQLEPIGFVFLVFFFFLMAVQFGGMFFHRFKTFSQIMANTEIDLEFWETKLEDVTKEDLEEKNPYKLFRKLVKLEGANGEDRNSEGSEQNVSRRNTVAFLAESRSRERVMVSDLDTACEMRLRKIERGETTDLSLSRKTLNAIRYRRSTLFMGQQNNLGHNGTASKPNPSPSSLPGPSHHRSQFSFQNPAFEDIPESVG